MIKAQDFLNELKKHNVGPFVEVPCSILNPLINRVIEDPEIELINPVNEAVAIGIASGAYMATGKLPVIMIQNSGFNNTTNALTSLNRTYNIPILYIITWRGAPGEKDAPEHDIMGEDMEKILKTYKVPYKIISPEDYKKDISWAAKEISKTKKPVALILKKGIIEKYSTTSDELPYEMSDGDAIKIIKDSVKEGEAVFVSTNGFISRDSFNIKDTPDFYMVGSMGHALPVAIGASKYTDKKIIVLDGDGGCLMHLGAMASVGAEKPKNLIHVVLDNQSYLSTGGQPTVSKEIDFEKYAEASGYRKILRAENKKELEKAINKTVNENGPGFIHVLLNRKNKEPSGRVSDKYTCQEIKHRFIDTIK